MGHYTTYLKMVREPPRAARFQVSTPHSMSTTHIKSPLDNPEDMFGSMSLHAIVRPTDISICKALPTTTLM